MASGGSLNFQEIDDMHFKKEFKTTYEKLQPFSTDEKRMADPEFKWRWARAMFCYGRELPLTQQKEMVTKAYEYIQEVLQKKEDSPDAHKWCSVMLNQLSEYGGPKQKITNAYEMQKHLERARELRPSDALTLHALGVWHFEVTDISWVKRKLAATLIANPPNSTYSAALKYFEDAEKARPGFYSMNALFAGKTLVRMKEYDKASEYLKKARDWPQNFSDDKKAHDEAIDLLRQIKKE